MMAYATLYVEQILESGSFQRDTSQAETRLTMGRLRKKYSKSRNPTRELRAYAAGIAWFSTCTPSPWTFHEPT